MFITHDLRAAQNLSDHMVMLQTGRVVEAGDSEYVMTQSQHPAVVRLRDAMLTVGQNRFGYKTISEGAVQ